MMESIGRYQIKKELGRGGMATVYIAHDPRIERDVAIKVLPRQFMHDPRFLERFQQEARTIATLEHFAIVPVYDFGEEDDAPYLVMRYMAGGSLRDRLTGEPVPLAETSQIIDRVAQGLDKAHEQGIIHRDLKPGNVLFDEYDLPYLADFGIARMAEATHTMTIAGTPAYMSPEQVQGQVKLDYRSDIYALGVMLFELLTGKQPFEAETTTGQMFMHVMDPVPDLRLINSDLPPESQAVVNKAMAKDREVRYQSASALAEAVKGLQDSGQQPDKRVAPAAAVTVIEGDATPEVAEPTVVEFDTPAQGLGGVTVIDTAVPDEAPPPSPPSKTGPAKQGGRSWIWWAVGFVLILLLGTGAWIIFGGTDRADQAQMEPETEPAAQMGVEEATVNAAPIVVTEAATAEPTAETGASQSETATPETVSAMPIEEPVTLRINWGLDDVTLDPALAFRDSAVDAASNLFMSLTRPDPVSGEPLPYLASGWDMNEDATVFTFTLRDDIPWVTYDPATGEWSQAVDDNGLPRFVNAHDVVYGVKRTIDPLTNSSNAYLLRNINNATALREEEFGVTLDDLGVEAVDERTVRFSLVEPAAYFPALTSLPAFGPQPQWVIEEWRGRWTDAGLIATHGPYGLEEWYQGRQLTLRKNPFWPEVDTVQIERVDGVMLEEPADVMALYEEDELDTFDVPVAEPDHGRITAALGDDLINAPLGCTYYYGFTNNKPPFDDVRVRTAFVQATDRQALIDQVVRGGQVPASSFAAPGYFGAPAPGTVGLQFDPAAAQTVFQQYLADTGQTIEMFNELGITLVHNVGPGHGDMAAAAAQMWRDTLGVNVPVEEQGWGDYLDTIRRDTELEQAAHIWRMSACADYPDQHRWAEIIYVDGSNHLRRNCFDDSCTIMNMSAYDELVIAAAGEIDPAQRREMYAEAERILAIDEAAYLPLYYHTAPHGTKPWLTRTYAVTGGDLFSEWTIDQAAQLAARGE